MKMQVLLKTQIHKAILISHDCGLIAASNQIRTDANKVEEGWMPSSIDILYQYESGLSFKSM